MKGLAPALVALLLLGCLLPVTILAEGEGVIEGQVVNATFGGGTVGEVRVVMRVYRDAEEHDPTAAVTDARGRFRFENLDVDSELTYLAQVSYAGVVYSSDPLRFESGGSSIVTRLTVYEDTTDDGAILIERAHLIVTVMASGLSVTELHVLSNSSDRTYVGREVEQGRRATSEFILPEGAQDLTFEGGYEGGRFLPTSAGFVDTEPLWPGRTSVVFRYSLGCEDAECTLARYVTRWTSVLNLLVPDSGVHVTSEDLTFDGKMETEGGGYLNFVGGEFPPGDTVVAYLRLPQVSAHRRRSPWTVAVIVLGSLAAVGALACPFWRKGKRT